MKIRDHDNYHSSKARCYEIGIGIPVLQMRRPKFREV